MCKLVVKYKKARNGIMLTDKIFGCSKDQNTRNVLFCFVNYPFKIKHISTLLAVMICLPICSNTRSPEFHSI